MLIEVGTRALVRSPASGQPCRVRVLIAEPTGRLLVRDHDGLTWSAQREDVLGVLAPRRKARAEEEAPAPTWQGDLFSPLCARSVAEQRGLFGEE